MDIRELERRRYHNSKRELLACMIVWWLFYKPNYSVELDEDMARRVEHLLDSMGNLLSTTTK